MFCLAVQVPSSENSDRVFFNLEILFTSVFAVELCVNFYGNYFLNFFRSAWNWFDAFVVVISLVSLVPLVISLGPKALPHQEEGPTCGRR